MRDRVYKFMPMRSLLAVILIIFGLFSCRPDESPTRHQQQVDSLLTELKRMNDSLNSLNIQEVQRIHDSLSRYYDTTAVVDTVEQTRQQLEEARNVLNWYDNIDREITFSRSHLRSLERQIKKKEVDTVVVREINTEKQIVAGLRERFPTEYRGLQQAIDTLLKK